ncbi:uncharacterized protein UTRI_10134 [Ustilago trichophora]|uniref:Uncharacterized protein n=1 Tax=Ustilago trichophora TaxID=86804 RepID=A0A5C3DZE9_9BASI|nr:uncharacterized protein UTRI_10134 [Ustilago trichophora]
MKLSRSPFLALTLVLSHGLLTTAFRLPYNTVIATTSHSRETALHNLYQLADSYDSTLDAQVYSDFIQEMWDNGRFNFSLSQVEIGTPS